MVIVDGSVRESVVRRGRHVPRMAAGSGTHGVAEARLPPVTLGAALAELVRRWNWKTALLSTLVRGSIFFSVNLTASWDT